MPVGESRVLEVFALRTRGLWVGLGRRRHQLRQQSQHLARAPHFGLPYRTRQLPGKTTRMWTTFQSKVDPCSAFRPDQEEEESSVTLRRRRASKKTVMMKQAVFLSQCTTAPKCTRGRSDRREEREACKKRIKQKKINKSWRVCCVRVRVRVVRLAGVRLRSVTRGRSGRPGRSPGWCRSRRACSC